MRLIFFLLFSCIIVLGKEFPLGPIGLSYYVELYSDYGNHYKLLLSSLSSDLILLEDGSASLKSSRIEGNISCPTFSADTTTFSFIMKNSMMPCSRRVHTFSFTNKTQGAICAYTSAEKIYVGNGKLHNWTSSDGIIGFNFCKYQPCTNTPFYNLLSGEVESYGISQDGLFLDLNPTSTSVFLRPQPRPSILYYNEIPEAVSNSISWGPYEYRTNSKRYPDFFINDFRFCSVSLFADMASNWPTVVDVSSACLILPREIYAILIPHLNLSYLFDDTNEDKQPDAFNSNQNHFVLSFRMRNGHRPSYSSSKSGGGSNKDLSDQLLYISLLDLIVDTSLFINEHGHPKLTSKQGTQSLCILEGSSIVENTVRGFPVPHIGFGSLVLHSLFYAIETNYETVNHVDNNTSTSHESRTSVGHFDSRIVRGYRVGFANKRSLSVESKPTSPYSARHASEKDATSIDTSSSSSAYARTSSSTASQSPSLRTTVTEIKEDHELTEHFLTNQPSWCNARPTCNAATYQLYDSVTNRCTYRTCSPYLLLQLNTNTGTCVLQPSFLHYLIATVILVVVIESSFFFVHQYSAREISRAVDGVDYDGVTERRARRGRRRYGFLVLKNLQYAIGYRISALLDVCVVYVLRWAPRESLSRTTFGAHPAPSPPPPTPPLGESPPGGVPTPTHVAHHHSDTRGSYHGVRRESESAAAVLSISPVDSDPDENLNPLHAVTRGPLNTTLPHARYMTSDLSHGDLRGDLVGEDGGGVEGSSGRTSSSGPAGSTVGGEVGRREGS